MGRGIGAGGGVIVTNCLLLGGVDFEIKIGLGEGAAGRGGGSPTKWRICKKNYPAPLPSPPPPHHHHQLINNDQPLTDKGWHLEISPTINFPVGFVLSVSIFPNLEYQTAWNKIVHPRQARPSSDLNYRYFMNNLVTETMFLINNVLSQSWNRNMINGITGFRIIHFNTDYQIIKLLLCEKIVLSKPFSIESFPSQFKTCAEALENTRQDKNNRIDIFEVSNLQSTLNIHLHYVSVNEPCSAKREILIQSLIAQNCYRHAQFGLSMRSSPTQDKLLNYAHLHGPVLIHWLCTCVVLSWRDQKRPVLIQQHLDFYEWKVMINLFILITIW